MKYEIYLLVLLLWECRFENQRWVRARIHGIRGSSQLAGMFVDLTGIISMIFGYSFLAAY